MSSTIQSFWVARFRRVGNRLVEAGRAHATSPADAVATAAASVPGVAGAIPYELLTVDGEIRTVTGLAEPTGTVPKSFLDDLFSEVAAARDAPGSEDP